LATAKNILVVDDELGMRELLEIVLENAGYRVTLAEKVDEALTALETDSFDCVLTDLYMGNEKEAGMRLLGWLQEHAPRTPAIMMTAHGSVEVAIEAMKAGAADYIQKPFKNEEIRLRIAKAITQQSLVRENEAYRQEQERQARIEGMIGQSAAFKGVLEVVKRVAKLPSTVAIHGESGAGKELVARALHQLSNRANKPFVAINCGGIPENLLESELFGYKKGAFTGANEDKEGLFVVANGGTLFLDEIGEMPLMLQVKLLRVLDNGLVTPVGGTKSTKVDVRIISATNRNLEKMSDEGTFRSDLYYRLNVIPIYVPPLRDRASDIPALVKHFIEIHSKSMERAPLEVTPEAFESLVSYSWPGNVRELGNVIERVLALCPNSEIQRGDLPRNIQEHVPPTSVAASTTLPDEGIDLEAMVAELEQNLIRQALQASRYSQKKAAQLLGLTARSLRYRLQKYGMDSD